MHALNVVYAARLGHPGGDLSVADILATLYFGVMRVDPKAPREPGRDRLTARAMRAARSTQRWPKPASSRSNGSRLA
jgi:transketolase N-terminal domain/subunit